MGTLLIAVAILTLFILGIVLFNGLVRRRNAATMAWANIDIGLKQRHDELPKLIDACKQYMGYESATIQAVVQARNSSVSAIKSGDVAAVSAAESKVGNALKGLFALAESYPDLKSAQSFLQLEQSISRLENSLADYRERYNSAVNDNNVGIEQFPANLVASMCNFRSMTLFQDAEAHDSDVNVSKSFSTS